MRVEQIRPFEVLSYIEETQCFVLDLRSQEEFRRGHLPRAVHINIEEIENGSFTYPKNKKILIYCLHGGQSLYAAGILKKRGYQVRNLSGGYEAYERLQKRKDSFDKQ